MPIGLFAVLERNSRANFMRPHQTLANVLPSDFEKNI